MIEYQLVPAGPDATCVVISGRLDSAGVEQADAPLTAAVRGSAGDVLLDLAKVNFVGSLGIRLLISMGRVLQRDGRHMVMFAVQPQVAEVFETVALSDLIPIASSQDEARQILASERGQA